MIAVLVNICTVLLGGGIGLALKKGIPEKVSNAIMIAIGLCSVYIGIDGALKGNNTIVLILSMVFGTAAGTLINIDGLLEKAGKFFENRFSKNKEENGKSNFVRGFVTGSLLFCVGSMTIVGSLNSGLKGDNTLIYTKSVLDFFSACVLASTLGAGVLLSALFILVYQGGLVLLAQLLSGLLTSEMLVNEITCCGSVIIIGLALNLIGITKIKVANMLPAMLFVPLFYYLIGLIPILN